MKQLFFLLFFFSLIFNLFAQEATQWRGANSSGIYKVEKLLPQWPADGPGVLWSFEKLGQGYSSPAFANNKIYINGMVNGQAVLFVLDMNGKELQEIKYGKEFDASYPGTRSTPTIVGDLAYLLTGHGILTCLNLKTGKPVWQKDFINGFGGSNITWGYTEAILVDGDKLFCTPGGKKNNVMALNRMTGETIWACPGLGEQSAYCTPLLIKLPARQLLVTHTSGHVVGVDATTGKLLWNSQHPNQWAVHPNTPIYQDGGLFVFSGYGQGGEKLKLSDDGSSITKEWDIKSFDSRMGGAVLIDGYLYGSGDSSRSWQCIDWKTGEQKYASTEMGKGVCIAVNDKLIGYSEKGELFMAEASPAAFKIISKTKVTLGAEQHWAHPVIFKGILYVRHGNALIAYKVSE
ncbi:MAG TPA: PQQ-binding-like beta-propeller repeat protein [Prolixibacteraceae bacterium]|nr:PQQ-binding-like beta-propeller repeat protein [Prolixibacteraceae bacterium]HPR85225.1 PQQ-binding-like beta-propeller repeat protein [Prolixibacteraceae bacterium]